MWAEPDTQEVNIVEDKIPGPIINLLGDDFAFEDECSSNNGSVID